MSLPPHGPFIKNKNSTVDSEQTETFWTLVVIAYLLLNYNDVL